MYIDTELADSMFKALSAAERLKTELEPDDSPTSSTHGAYFSLMVIRTASDGKPYALVYDMDDHIAAHILSATEQGEVNNALAVLTKVIP